VLAAFGAADFRAALRACCPAAAALAPAALLAEWRAQMEVVEVIYRAMGGGVI
jgi:hypothetical protein